jgi:hypothetical protein
VSSYETQIFLVGLPSVLAHSGGRAIPRPSLDIIVTSQWTLGNNMKRSFLWEERLKISEM